MAFEKVAKLDDIAVGSAIAVESGVQPVALVRTATDMVKAIHNICSHQYYELAPEGCVEGNSIECALHGSIFDLDTGSPTTLPALEAIPVYDCKIVNGDVLVDVGQQRNDARPPRH